MMDKSREQFEAWAKSKWDGELGSKDEYGDYYFEPVQLQWEGWQASRAAVEIEHPEQDSYLGTRQVTFERDAMWLHVINEQGLKVKQ